MLHGADPIYLSNLDKSFDMSLPYNHCYGEGWVLFCEVVVMDERPNLKNYRGVGEIEDILVRTWARDPDRRPDIHAVVAQLASNLQARE